MLRRTRIKPPPKLQPFDFGSEGFVQPEDREADVAAVQEDFQNLDIVPQVEQPDYEPDFPDHDIHLDDADDHILPALQPQVMLQQTIIHDTDDAWLTNKLRDEKVRRSVRVLQVDENREILILMPSHDQRARTIGIASGHSLSGGTQKARKNPFCFLKIRLLAFEDGAFFCSWCTNPGCERSSAVQEKFAAEVMRELHMGKQYADTFGDEPPLCQCANAVVHMLWDSVGDVADINQDDSMASFYMEHDPFSAIRNYTTGRCVMHCAVAFAHGDHS